MFRKTTQLYLSSFAGLSRDIWLLSFVTLINRSGAMVIPFLTIYLTMELGYTLTEAGWVMGCFGLGSVVGTMIGGRLTDRLGYYPVLFWSLLLGGGMFFILQRMENFYPMCITIFFLTMIADAFRPASMTAVAAYSLPENRTRSISLVRLAINLGFSVGPAVGGVIALSAGYDWLFWIDGLSCIIAAFFFRYYIKEKPMQVTEAEQKELDTGVVLSPFSDHTFLFFLAMLFLSAFAFVPFFSAVPVYFRQDLLLNEAEIGGLLAINGLLIALVEMPIVYVLEEKYHHLRLVGIGVALIGLSYVIFNVFGAYLGSSLLALLAILSITIGEIFNIPFANTWAMNRSNPANRGRYMGLYGNAYSVAHVLSPIIGLQIAEHYGFGMLWYLLAGICVISLLGMYALEKRTP